MSAQEPLLLRHSLELRTELGLHGVVRQETRVSSLEYNVYFDDGRWLRTAAAWTSRSCLETHARVCLRNPKNGRNLLTIGCEPN